MSELSGIKAIWYRESKVFFREKSRVFSQIVTPLMWLLIFGSGLGSIVDVEGNNYQIFIYPGVIAQSILFSALFFGTYIIWDRKIDFLKEVLVAPISRTSIFIGKILGGATDSLIQSTALLLFAFIFGISLSPVQIVLFYIFSFLFIVTMASMGLIIGSLMESPEGFGLIISFVAFPMFLLSGALYPLQNLPLWLSILNKINPASYAVDAFRSILIGMSNFGLLTDFVVLSGFALVLIGIGTVSFKRMKV